jgi:acyl transferase domain-containing protein
VFEPAVLTSSQLFDARRFGVSGAEAEMMDPQQRLLLECAYAALHSASFERAALDGSDVGVALGIYALDFELVRHGSPQPLLFTHRMIAQPPQATAACLAPTACA